jgi:hypothetical protein
MIIVTGRTFDHRETIISMGGRWNNADRRWEFDRLSASLIARLRALVGIMVVDQPDSLPSLGDDYDDDDDLFAAIIGKRRPNKKPSKIYGDDPTYHNHFADQNASAFFGFSNFNKFIDYVDTLPSHVQSDPNRTGWSIDRFTEKFTGTRTMSEAIKIAREGWQEGVERATDLIERLSLDNPRVKRRKAALAGGVVSVGRMLSGDPAHMIRRPKQPGRKVVTFFVEAGCQGTIEPENMAIRAALVGAIVDLMENAGYSCAIVATDTSLDMGRPIYQLAVTVKESGERLNLADTMFALGHPSFLRRMSFATCCSAIECRDIWIGQGSSSNAFDDDHPCGRSEYYVPVLTTAQQRELTDDPLSMLPFVTPKNLPIDINGE